MVDQLGQGQGPDQEGVIRVRLPRKGEVLGYIDELLGASRFRVTCKDGHQRMCRIPGKFRKRIKIRVGDIVLIEPWTVESDAKGDIIWIYNKTHAEWLRKRNIV
ncbi:MAG: translation initiation factor eIF-1A [Candidatus Aenigmarchaeota archaeon]|nr:translation initiation factor eIF-1A [Candidatus Aenigmarchaeota archaeon]